MKLTILSEHEYLMVGGGWCCSSSTNLCASACGEEYVFSKSIYQKG